VITDPAARLTALADRATRAPLRNGGAMSCPVLLWIPSGHQ
jgi:hypothetical protein